jgi:hypothetical protein
MAFKLRNAPLPGLAHKGIDTNLPDGRAKSSAFQKKDEMKKASYKGFPIKYPANVKLEDYIRMNKAELDKMVARGK